MTLPPLNHDILHDDTMASEFNDILFLSVIFDPNVPGGQAITDPSGGAAITDPTGGAYITES